MSGAAWDAWNTCGVGRVAANMKAIGVIEFGGPEALAAHNVIEPHPGPGEARLRVTAVAVSPVDIKVRSGGLGTGGLEPPYVPGMDAAGVIDEVGPGSRWEIGDEVMAMALPLSAHGGAYVEYLVGPDESMTRVPVNVDMNAASTVPMNGLTAIQALEMASLEPRQTLVVTGAAGTLGNYVIELAKHAGLSVIADAAEKDRMLVEGLGADHVVARGDNLADRIRAIVPDGADALIDAARLNEKALPAVRNGGAFVSLGSWEGPPTRGVTFHCVSVFDEYRSAGKLDSLRRHVQNGVLTPRVADTFSAEQAGQAHRLLEGRGVRGRLVLTF